MELIWAELGAEGAWVGLGLAADVEQEGGAGEAEEPEAEAHRGVPAHPSRFQCWMHTPALCACGSRQMFRSHPVVTVDSASQGVKLL